MLKSSKMKGPGRSPGDVRKRPGLQSGHRPDCQPIFGRTGEAQLKSFGAARRGLDRQTGGQGFTPVSIAERAGSSAPLDPETVIYHGSAGAFAHIACDAAFPEARSVACDNLIGVIDAVRTGRVDAAVLPCENILAGRVPDIHLLLPESGLWIAGEIFLPIQLHLVAPKGWSFDRIERVHSHPVALKQVQRFLTAHGLSPVEASNTATAAALIKRKGDPADAAVASALAARTYDLSILRHNIEDNPFNMTRFYVLAARPVIPMPEQPELLTSLLFEVSNKPGALFRAVGGFADNDINLTKLESYLVGGQFVATRFFCEFEGHPDHAPVRRALENLKGHTTGHSILGVFPMHTIGSQVRANRALGPTRAGPDRRRR